MAKYCRHRVGNSVVVRLMGMKPRPKTQIVADIRRHTKRLSEERDKLRVIYDELCAVMETTEEGLNEIGHGLDLISENL